jgi:nucleolin
MSEDSVAKQVFVRNINYKTVGQALGDAFKRFGEVTGARIITEQYFDERRSLGFGFVDFATAAAAAAAVSSTDPIIVDGRTLAVRVARPRAPRKRDTIFVSSIPAGTTEDDLKAHFAKYNPIAVRIVHTNTKDTRGFAFVQFDTEENQTAAHRENREFEFRGAQSRVQFARRALGSRRLGFRRGPARAARAPVADAGDSRDGAVAARGATRGPRNPRRARPAGDAAPRAQAASGN